MQENWEVVNLHGRGRGLVARCDIAGGDKIMQEVALSAVTVEEWSLGVCHQCFRMAARFSGCADCKHVGWCSKECEIAGAESHHKGGDCSECNALARLDTDILRDGDAALAKLFVKLLCRRAVELAVLVGGDEERLEYRRLSSAFCLHRCTHRKEEGRIRASMLHSMLLQCSTIARALHLHSR